MRTIRSFSNREELRAYLLKTIPLGSSIGRCVVEMTKHDFRCTYRENQIFWTLGYPETLSRFVLCEYSHTETLTTYTEEWQVALVYEIGVLKKILVAHRMLGTDGNYLSDIKDGCD